MQYTDPEKRASYAAELGAAFGRRLREARLETDLSTARLARSAGVGRQTIIAAERGDGGAMALCAVAAVADALGVRRAWLAWGDPPKR